MQQHLYTAAPNSSFSSICSSASGSMPNNCCPYGPAQAHPPLTCTQLHSTVFTALSSQHLCAAPLTDLNSKGVVQ